MANSHKNIKAELLKRTCESIVRVAFDGGQARVGCKSPETGNFHVAVIDQAGALCILNWWLDRRAAECWHAMSEGSTVSADEKKFLQAWTAHRTLEVDCTTDRAPSLTVSEAERFIGMAATVAYGGEAPSSLDDHLFNPIQAEPEWRILDSLFGPTHHSQAVKAEAGVRFVERFQQAQQAFLDRVSSAREEYMGARFTAAAKPGARS